MRRSYTFTAIFLFIIIFISANVHANVTPTIKKVDTPHKITNKNKKQTNRKNKNKNISSSPSLNSTFHKVKKGETLSYLSKKYSIPVTELKKINNLRSSTIIAGQKLLLKHNKAKTYTVKRGDNIWKIARRFNIKVDKLKNINNLKTDLLKPGLTLILEEKAEQEKTNSHEAILSHAYIEEEIEGVLGSEEYSLEEKVTLIAKKLLNIPYRLGGNSLNGIDCSAFVKKVYSLIDVDLPRSARKQFLEGINVDKDELSAGDLVFFKTRASVPSHVGIYLGDNMFIHASSKDKKVRINSLETPYYMKRFIGGKKILEEKEDKEKFDNEG
ncbi:MAG: NlpC/P60 family protein [Pseudomonadota bacterium]